MNRHGISQNPTVEESALLRKLWDGDDARARTQRLINENRRLLDERDRLQRENAALRERAALNDEKEPER